MKEEVDRSVAHDLVGDLAPWAARELNRRRLHMRQRRGLRARYFGFIPTTIESGPTSGST